MEKEQPEREPTRMRKIRTVVRCLPARPVLKTCDELKAKDKKDHEEWAHRVKSPIPFEYSDKLTTNGYDHYKGRSCAFQMETMWSLRPTLKVVLLKLRRKLVARKNIQCWIVAENLGKNEVKRNCWIMFRYKNRSFISIFKYICVIQRTFHISTKISKTPSVWIDNIFLVISDIQSFVRRRTKPVSSTRGI